MKVQSYVVLLVAVLMSSCASTREPITLEAAVAQTVQAMKDAYNSSQQAGGTWGPAPSEVTIVYNISNEVGTNKQLTLAAATATASLGGAFGLTEKAVTGNTITLKFTRK